MGRSGSMWTFNVVRELLRRSGFNVLPKSYLPDQKSRVAVARRALDNPDPCARWVFKTHDLIGSDFPKSRFVATRRDPRDVLISQMRFTEIDFEAGLRAACHYAERADAYARFPDSICLQLEYTDIVADPVGVCQRLGNFLELEASDGQIDAIVAQFSKARVAALVQGLAAKEANEADLPDSEKSVQRVDRNRRRIDLTTNFQSGHVSNYVDGDWRRLLSPEQRAQIHKALGSWLEREGYEPDC